MGVGTGPQLPDDQVGQPRRRSLNSAKPMSELPLWAKSVVYLTSLGVIYYSGNFLMRTDCSNDNRMLCIGMGGSAITGVAFFLWAYNHDIFLARNRTRD